MDLLKSLRKRFFPPSCPVSPKQKSWIEEAFFWFGGKFGWEPVAKPVITPTSGFFPVRWEATPEELEDVQKRVCRYMQVRRSRIRFELYRDDHHRLSRRFAFEQKSSGAAGLFMEPGADGRFVVGIDEKTLEDPGTLVATLAHELAHVRLLGEGHLGGQEEDHEELTDLLPVFFGLGIFTANSVFRFQQWEEGTKTGWSAQRTGYLSEELLGYALALYAWLREEDRPAWRRFLLPNVEHFFQKSMRYLEITGDVTLTRGLVRILGTGEGNVVPHPRMAEAGRVLASIAARKAAKD